MRIVIPVINTIRPLAIGASTNALSERAVTYDRNGNILSLSRFGADTAVPEDSLAYSYNGNMLVGVSNSGPSGGGGTYAHDANDYYPFGKRIPLPVSGSTAVTEALSVTEPVEVTAPVEATVASTSSATSQNRWLFSGKESQSFLSASIPLLDFGARMYDPITARWTAQDPLAEKYYAVSPYAYCLGNPDTNARDVAGAIAAHKTSHVIYDKEE